MTLGDTAIFDVKALKSYEELQLPESYDLVSDIFDVSCSRTFRNDVTLTFYHAVPIENEKECSDFAFFTTEDTKLKLLPVDGGKFNVRDHYASIGVKHFSRFGIFKRKRSVNKINLRCLVSYEQDLNSTHELELNLFFYVTRNCYADLQVSCAT